MNATEAVTPGAREKPDILKTADVVKALRKERPNLLDMVPETKAVALINAALVELGKRIGAINVGAVKVPGLGNFRVRQVEREKDGQRVTVTHTVFWAAKGQAKGGQRASGKP